MLKRQLSIAELNLENGSEILRVLNEFQSDSIITVYCQIILKREINNIVYHTK